MDSKIAFGLAMFLILFSGCVIKDKVPGQVQEPLKLENATTNCPSDLSVLNHTNAYLRCSVFDGEIEHHLFVSLKPSELKVVPKPSVDSLLSRLLTQNNFRLDQTSGYPVINETIIQTTTNLCEKQECYKSKLVFGCLDPKPFACKLKPVEIELYIYEVKDLEPVDEKRHCKYVLDRSKTFDEFGNVQSRIGVIDVC